MNIEELNRVRKQQGLSIDELAKRSNLPKSTIEKVLFGIVKHPRIDTMQAIEEALGLSTPPLQRNGVFSTLSTTLNALAEKCLPIK